MKERVTAVYVLVSSPSDTYYEQALLSVKSLRLHNPELPIVILVDKNTETTLVGNRDELGKLAKIQTVETPKDYSAKEKSRHIKTYIRKILSGTLLFLDTDTIIAENIENVVETQGDVLCTLDYHLTLDRHLDKESIIKKIAILFNIKVPNGINYYNSGVILMRDTSIAHNLFERWNYYWRISAFEKKHCMDQPALMMANIECGSVIKELPGIYNCQVLTSIEYLHKAAIVHFFNVKWEGKENLSPFFNPLLYKWIKQTGKIPVNLQEYLYDCRSAFFSPTLFINREKILFTDSIVGHTLYSMYRKQSFSYKIVEGICYIRSRLINIGCKIRSWIIN